MATALLTLGSDTLARIGAKDRKVEEELEAWRVVAVSTDIVEAAQ
ncbi:hypothetical protein ACTMU2_10930 [Cupriavidus basilensis]